MDIKKTSLTEEIKALRISVFCNEQGYPADKLFDNNETADYLAVFSNGAAVGCGRFYPETEDTWHIDNIALKKEARGNGTGKKLVEDLVNECKNNGAAAVTVNAESYAVGFYEKCGFSVYGCEYKDENFMRVPLKTTFEFDGCSWLESENGMDAFVARKSFNAENVKKAVLRVTAIGFFEPYLNGCELTSDRYIPAWSNYEKRDLSGATFPVYDTMTQRIYYLEFDITDKLVDGKNVMSFHIGNGWYGQAHPEGGENLPKWGENKLIFKLMIDHENGEHEEINSDETVKWKKSYVVHTNTITNETFDGRLYEDDIYTVCYDDSSWQNMTSVEKVNALMVKQTFPGDKYQYGIEPELIYENGERKIYDLKEDTAGRWVLRFRDDAKDGDEAELTFCEAIDENFELLLRHTGGEWRRQRDICICSEKKSEFSSTFTWRAGRYVELIGNAELIRFDVWYSDVKRTATFESGNENLNWYLNAYCHTQNCNIHTMVPSDCPHRERLGYTGDGQLCSRAGMMIFDSEALYRKWMDDIADSQDIRNGHVQHTAPFYGGGGGPGGWGGAMVLVPWNFYRHYGDVSVLEKYYNRMLKYLDYMQSKCEDNIVTYGEKGHWCLGDWCTPNNDIKIPEKYVNTYFYIKCIGIMIKVSALLGKDADELGNRLDTVTAAFNKHFFDKETGSYLEGIQGADAFALDIGQGDSRTVKNLAAKYEELGQYDTGIFGTDLVTRMLFEHGYASLALKLLTNEKEISFYNMKKQGATTLWENWDGCDSQSHPMFGAATEYIFTYILGIKQPEDSCGFECVEIDPAYLPELGNISGSIETVNGKISVSVRYTDGIRSVRFSVGDKIAIVD